MSLINCPECGREVSDHALTCPGCGYPLQEDAAKTTLPVSAPIIAKEEVDAPNSTVVKIAHAKKISRNAIIGIFSAVFICILAVVLFTQGFILTGDDKAVYDLMISSAGSFKNPSSVRIVSGTYDDGDLFARVSAENSFGVDTAYDYMISNSYCYQDNSGSADNVYQNSNDFHIKLVNKALARKLGK